MTVACSIQLSGTGFANTNNVKVQGSGTTCGATAATGYTGMTLTKSVTDSGNLDVYALGTASAGVAVNNLVLCFAYTSNYAFQISSAFQMSGPLVGNEDCTLTETCSLQLSGVGLADTNKLRIIASSDNCGGAAVVGVTSITGLSGTTSVTTGGTSNVYAVASSQITAGVHGSGYKLCWAHNPSGNADYMFEVGTFTLKGAAAADFTCPLTDACSIQLSGTGLANTNNVKVQGSGTTCYGERIHLQLLFKLAVTDTADLTILVVQLWFSKIGLQFLVCVTRF